MVAALGLGTLEIDSLDMRTYGYNVSTRTGRYAMPGFRGDDPVLPGRSGYTFASTKPYEPGVGTLAVWCDAHVPSTGALASTMTGRRTQFEANMMTLQRIFTRRHKLSTIRASQPDASIRRAYVQWEEWDDPTVQMGGMRAEWDIGFTIPAVFWEDESLTQQSATAGSSLPKTFNMSSFAGMTGIIEDATVTVAGPITNPRVTDSETGYWVQYTGTVSNGSTWTINAGNSTSSIGGSSVLANTTHAGTYRLYVVPNNFSTSTTPQLVLSGSSGGANTNVTVSARRKWVSG